MDSLKFLHLADLHKNTKRYHDLELSLDVAEETAKCEKVAAILIAGDLYDGAEQNSEIGLHTPFARRIQRLGNIAPVAIVKGTPTHDIPGSLDGFELLSCEFGVTILQPGETYFLDGFNARIVKTYVEGQDKAVIFGLAEPGRSWVAARTVDGKAKTGDEINAELRALVSGLLLGYGAKRCEYPNLPCLFMYHGQVRGCRLSNGTTLPDGPVSADDLRQVGADYYALGDIHEPQQIPGLPAYYPGSVYTDWGEYHKAGCNLVELYAHLVDGILPAKITRVDFPHPQRVKVSVGDLDPVFDGEVKGKQAWVEITLSKDKAQGLDTDAVLAQMIKFGALPGSRVTLSILPTETVRAGEIAKKATLAEKVELQGENSSTPYAPSILAKAAEVEAAVGSLAALAGPEKRFRNIWTRLRGSKGFWNKQRKDEVFIPWAESGGGVIPYVGPNGNGKTTSYDFAKPWAIPVSRPPKTLKAHFRLRDSAVENLYLEEASGTYYRTLINIDGANKSGDAKYFFYRGPSAEGPWAPYSEEACSGRQDGFFAAIDEVFGSMAIYMRTAFAAQTPTPDFPDIARATKEEKKGLIGELAGKDYGPYRDYATAKVKTGEAELVTLDATIAAAADVDETLERLGSEKAEAEKAETVAGDAAVAASDVEKLRAAEREALSLKVAEATRKEERRAQIDKEVKEVDRTLADIAAEIAGFVQAAEGRDAAEKELKRIADLEAKRAELLAEKQKIDDANSTTLRAHSEEVRALGLRRQSAQSDLDTDSRALAEAEKAEALARAKVDPEAEAKVEMARAALAKAEERAKEADEAAAGAKASIEALRKKHAEARALPSLLEQLHNGEPCPVCGSANHPAPAHADLGAINRLEAEGKQAMNRADEVLAEASAASGAMAIARDRLQAAETAAQASKAAQEALAGLESITQDAKPAKDAAQAALSAIVVPPPPEPAPFPGEQALASLEAELDFCDPEAKREIIRKADEAAVRTEEAKKRQATAEERRGALVRENVSLAATPEELQLVDLLAAKDTELEAARSKLSAAREAGAAARATIKAKTDAIADAKKRRDERTKAQGEREIKAADLAEWRILERAIEGVRDLELDALAPSIADIATRLLQSSGREGHIEIDTTRISSGSAKKAKQIEDFLIFHVGTDGERQDIATCSGGEMVWIRKALYDAFAIIRARNGNIKFMTAFLDETDGALYPKDRQDYFRMLVEAHKESGRYQTFLTTHSPEIESMADVTLDVTSLGPRGQAKEGGIAA